MSSTGTDPGADAPGGAMSGICFPVSLKPKAPIRLEGDDMDAGTLFQTDLQPHANVYVGLLTRLVCFCRFFDRAID